MTPHESEVAYYAGTALVAFGLVGWRGFCFILGTCLLLKVAGC